MEIILIRHGQTPGNALRRYIGRTDEPLSKEGEEAAKRVGGIENVVKVYVSPLLRAKNTAEILFKNASKVIKNDLRETDFGDFENRSAVDMEFDPAYRKWVDEMCETPCPNGDDPKEVKERTCKCIKSIINSGEEKIIIVAHGGTIMSAMERFDSKKLSYYDYSVKNLGGYMAEVVFENGEIVFINSKKFTDIREVMG